MYLINIFINILNLFYKFYFFCNIFNLFIAIVQTIRDQKGAGLETRPSPFA